jgi:O-6-methylguanine DNA methyltransferase
MDHCFARIILDAAVGRDAPWMAKIKSPAYKNMSTEQLEASIDLGRRILTGEADLVALNNQSLALRAKRENASRVARGDMFQVVAVEDKKKRPQAEDELGGGDGPCKRAKASPSPSRSETNIDLPSPKPPCRQETQKEDLGPYLKKIALSSQTDFQKKVLTTLCQVPRGRYSTYGMMAKHLDSSPRAVGNALRNNPFAPHVPCHRILASGGGLGGFHGSWGKKGQEGLYDEKKRRLLRDEGVRFDGKGKVVGGPWANFT